jgi:hypothetical protein
VRGVDDGGAGRAQFLPLHGRTGIELAQPFETQVLEHVMDGRRTSFRSTSAGFHGLGRPPRDSVPATSRTVRSDTPKSSETLVRVTVLPF